MGKDYYKVLGVPRGTSDDNELKKGVCLTWSHSVVLPQFPLCAAAFAATVPLPYLACTTSPTHAHHSPLLSSLPQAGHEVSSGEFQPHPTPCTHTHNPCTKNRVEASSSSHTSHCLPAAGGLVHAHSPTQPLPPLPSHPNNTLPAHPTRRTRTLTARTLLRRNLKRFRRLTKCFPTRRGAPSMTSMGRRG
jgi:hypothetical protein